jgi:hypothetical protein
MAVLGESGPAAFKCWYGGFAYVLSLVRRLSRPNATAACPNLAGCGRSLPAGRMAIVDVLRRAARLPRPSGEGSLSLRETLPFGANLCLQRVCPRYLFKKPESCSPELRQVWVVLRRCVWRERTEPNPSWSGGDRTNLRRCETKSSLDSAWPTKPLSPTRTRRWAGAHCGRVAEIVASAALLVKGINQCRAIRRQSNGRPQRGILNERSGFHRSASPHRCRLRN